MLIFTLSLVGAVSAGDNVTYSDDVPLLEDYGEIEMEVADLDEYENIDSLSSLEEKSLPFVMRKFTHNLLTLIMNLDMM